MQKRQWIVAGSLLAGALAFMSQVGPREAVKNVCDWAADATRHGCPAWLDEQNIPRFVPLALWAVFIAGITWAMWPQFQRVITRNAPSRILHSDTAAPLHWSRRVHPYRAAGIAVLTVLALSGFWFIGTGESRKPPHLLTLRDLFENDWPAMPAFYHESILTEPDARRVNFSWRVNGNFDDQSRFMSLYLGPNVAPQDAVNLCVYLSAHYQELVDFTDKQIDVSFRRPTDTEAMHLKDMLFSRRFYLYYENNDFSDIQTGPLKVLFRQSGMTIEFRGHAYAWNNRDDHRPMRKAPLVTDSVLIPDAQLYPGLQIRVDNLMGASH